MYLPTKQVFRLIRKYKDRDNEEITTEIGVYTTMEKASRKLMQSIINLAKMNIREAVYVKGAIRGRGVATISELQKEVENHGFKIETIRVSE